MAEYSRPATLEDLELLLRSLHEHGADYLLIGGYALAAHGCQRAATDIDVLVPATVQAGRRDKDAADRTVIERALEVSKLHGGDESGGRGED